ncbi:MAG: hypothetical protein ACK4NF_03855 [Planctomycetota bacterium]
MVRIISFLMVVAVTILISEELPVKKVVIYKNGICYVERETILNGSGVVVLKFKAHQMKDILKTLFALPLQQGSIQNIDYQSEEPLSKKLEDIKIPLPQVNTLTSLLQGLQGAKIIINGTETVTVLGIEIKKTQTKDGNILEQPLLVHIDSYGRIATMNIEFLNFTIEDQNIRNDFEKLVGILNSTKYADQKNVSIYYKDFANSPLRVGYVIESPIWKTTYRVFLDAKPSPLLQSFAIIENNTLDDWKDVKVVIVGSGPFSYLVDLYTAIIPSRPTVSIEELFGIVRGGGVKREPVWGDRSTQAHEKFAALRSADEGAKKEALGEIVEKGLRATAEGKNLGEYFSYEITEPVTILRGNAGLVNILSENIEGEKILYYDESQSRDVFNAFLLKNNTKNVLDNGFVTFFEGQSTVGEGYLKRQLKSGEKEIITYGIEKSINVETNIATTSSGYTSIKLTNGVLTAQYYSYLEKKYKIFNKTQKLYTIIIDYPKNIDYELVEPKDANIREDLPALYRFRVSLQPGSTTEFKVVERQLMSEYIYLDISNINTISYLLSSGKLSPAAKKIVEECAKILKEIETIEEEVRKINNRNNYLSEYLKTIRNNIETLTTANPEEAKIRAKHIANLDKFMTEYEENGNKLEELGDRKRKLLEDLRNLISSYSE